eukprot:6923326-Alexandrium_andersonii.AAC.1
MRTRALFQPRRAQPACARAAVRAPRRRSLQRLCGDPAGANCSEHGGPSASPGMLRVAKIRPPRGPRPPRTGYS